MQPKVPTLMDFDNRLRVKVRAKSLIHDHTTDGNAISEKRKGKQGGKPGGNRKDSSDISSFATGLPRKSETQEVIQCPVCSRNHKVEDCPTFKSKTVDQRAQTTKEKNLCFSCLSSTEHRTRKCSQRKRCGVETVKNLTIR